MRSRLLHRDSHRKALPIQRGGWLAAWAARAWRRQQHRRRWDSRRCPQRAGRGGVEQAANDGFAYGSHGAGSCGW